MASRRGGVRLAGNGRAAIGRALRAVGVTRRGLAFTPVQQSQLETTLRDALAKVEHRFDDLLSVVDPATAGDDGRATADASILEAYCTDVPTEQTAIDIFRGEWASAFPAPLAHLSAGSAPLFAAPHVPWGVEVLGGVVGQRVLELGPLEGGHTYLLDRLGAAEVVAVEANTRAYLKCLISKELIGIPSARFLCGDFVAYLEREVRSGARFDLCLASGVLYHLRDPVAALDLLCQATDRLVLWTHYFDEEYIRSRSDLSVKFPVAESRVHSGFHHTLHRQEYQSALSFQGFCGGSAESSAWMTRADVLSALEHFGFEVVDIGHEEQNHKGNGPCFCVAARRLWA